MSDITTSTFDDAYRTVIRILLAEGEASVSRKGAELRELHNFSFTVENPMDCWAASRAPSLSYLKNEFEFYLSGSNLLKDAVKCSKFWNKCSDDGETINSNYGKRIFFDKNSHGNTSFRHALNCLKNNRSSKKAVMMISEPENSFVSNDNFCSMYLHARIDEDQKLHLTAHMRSNDIFFGTPYDVPFFVFVQLALIDQLKSTYPELELGTYTHFANSLHMYERNKQELSEAVLKVGLYNSFMEFHHAYRELLSTHLETVTELLFCPTEEFMRIAWAASKSSGCTKKMVGCCLTELDPIDNVEKVITTGYGGMVNEDGTPYTCDHCDRDDPKIKFFGDSCLSVHAEMRCIHNVSKHHINLMWDRVTMYCTHGVCDACLKLLALYGIKKVVYDIDYKVPKDRIPFVKQVKLEDIR